jgi:YgiT-type zinc finger domain-containing protein
MICSNCFNDEYRTITISKNFTVNGVIKTIKDMECEQCPSCKDIIFTHQQSLELDKKRINLEFSSKPILNSYQLKLLRKILNLGLDEICELVHIGRNSYGRWEREESDISPSMNLLIHQLIDRFPQAKVNLFESEMSTEIEKAKRNCLTDSVSLGEFVRNVIQSTKLLKDVVCDKIGIKIEALEKIENNELHPEKIPEKIAANIVKFFHLTLANLRNLLDNTLKVYSLRGEVSFVHARQPGYGKGASAIQAKSINKILEQYVIKDAAIPQQTISSEYLKRVGTYLQNTQGRERS